MPSPLDDFFFFLFRRAGTRRLYEGGPIPDNAVLEVARDNGIDKLNENMVVEVVMAMDQAFCDFHSEELDKGRKK